MPLSGQGSGECKCTEFAYNIFPGKYWEKNISLILFRCPWKLMHSGLEDHFYGTGSSNLCQISDKCLLFFSNLSGKDEVLAKGEAWVMVQPVC